MQLVRVCLLPSRRVLLLRGPILAGWPFKRALGFMLAYAFLHGRHGTRKIREKYKNSCCDRPENLNDAR